MLYMDIAHNLIINSYLISALRGSLYIPSLLCKSMLVLIGVIGLIYGNWISITDGYE